LLARDGQDVRWVDRSCFPCARARTRAVGESNGAARERRAVVAGMSRGVRGKSCGVREGSCVVRGWRCGPCGSEDRDAGIVGRA
jgi:hypothetical protein